MFGWFKNFLNDIRVENEHRRYLDYGLWKNDYYSRGDYIKYKECHTLIFHRQDEMIEKGMLIKRWTGRYEESSELSTWLEENLKGYYDVRAQGNGRGNPGQIDNGIWHVEIFCMRESDAMAVKLRWQ